jgi:hypothetical protein
MRSRSAFAALSMLSALSPAPAPASPGVAGCDAFLEKLRAEAGDLQLDFSHALIVSRAKTDSDVFYVTTKSEVDGTLTCHRDAFVRFEARIKEPASARAASGFERMQAAALRAGLGWDADKSRTTLRAMAADAKEFLAASRERGDVYIAGKTEEHAPGGISLGLIVTEADRAFVIAGPSD